MHQARAHRCAVDVAATSTDGDRLRYLEAVVAALAAPAAVERMAAVVGESAMKALEANLVVVALLEGGRRHLRAVHTVGIAPGALGDVLMGRTDEAGPPAQDDPLLNGSSAQRRGEALIAQRIAAGASSLGLMVLGRLSDRPFSEHDRAFLHVLGGLFALALDRRRLADRRRQARAALRRPAPAIGRIGTQLEAGDLKIDIGRHKVSFDGRVVRLTPSELRLLVFLAEEPGLPRTRREILRHLSDADHVGHERACDVHISNLRRKIEQDPSKPERLVTLRGVGYALNGAESRQLSAGARRA